MERVCTDEAAHLALNWMVTREVARTRGGLASAGLLANPNISRGMLAVPFMSLEVYSLAHRLGYDFGTLLPPFGRLWRLHERFPELERFALWWPYRAFAAAGAIATMVCMGLVRTRLLFLPFWLALTRLFGFFARLGFGGTLLARRGLPPTGPVKVGS